MGKYRFRGNVYASIGEMAKSFGVDPEWAETLYDAGWELIDIMENRAGVLNGIVVNNPNTFDEGKLVIEGYEFGSIEEAREFFGVPQDEFYKRLLSGWSIYACLGIDELWKSFYNTPFGLYHDGRLYKSHKEISDEAGISKSAVKSRLMANWRASELLGLAERDIPYGKHHRVPVEYKGDRYESMVDICTKLNLRYDIFIEEYRKGLDVDEVVEKSRRK